MANKPVNARSCEHRAKTATAKKLIQAAALAAVLVPLGSVAVETATINCMSNGSGCVGTYTPSGSSLQSNTWKFFETNTSLTPIYTLTIEGVPLDTFTLSVEDVVTSQVALLDGPALSAFPNSVCIPTYDSDSCGLFDVFEGYQPASWDADGYYMTITWFDNANPLSQPPDDGLNYILQAKNAFGGTTFTNQLGDTEYDPQPVPDDPALGGRGDSFSRFGAFRTVPEPATLLLFGTGAVVGLYRRRRKHL